jgi:5-methylcytosine-specific restriction endonuclease McrA
MTANLGDEFAAHVRAKIRRAVLTRDKGVCQLRLKVCTYTATQADHIRPRATHGDGLDNLQAACAACNRAKGEPDPLDDPAPLPGAW